MKEGAPSRRVIEYRDLASDDGRNRQITADVTTALRRGRHCLVLTQGSRTCASSPRVSSKPVTTRSSSAAAWAPVAGTRRPPA